MLTREDACEMLETAEAQVKKYEALLMDIEELLGSLGNHFVTFRNYSYDYDWRFTPIEQARSAILYTIGRDKFNALLSKRGEDG